jgi:hypothetical protein
MSFNPVDEEYVAGTSATCTYNEGFSAHHKVVYMVDTSSSTTNLQWNVTFSPIQIGTIEFFIAPVTYDGVLTFRIGDTEYAEAMDYRRIDMYTWPSLGMRSSKDGYADATIAYVLGTWYHIRVDFNTNTDTFSLYRDGSLWDTGTMNGDSDGISKLMVWSYGTYQGAGYFDAIDISSATGFYPRRNQVINTSVSIKSLYYPTHQMASLGWTTWNLYVTPNAYNSITGITDGTALIHFIQNLTTGDLLDVRFSSGSISTLTFTGPTNNVELYSESDQITKWVFDQPTIVYNENFSTWGTNKSAQFNYTSSTNTFYNIYEQYPTLHQVQSVGLIKSGPTTEIDTYFQFNLFSQTHFSGLIGKYSIGTFVPSPNYIDLSNCSGDLNSVTWNTKISPITLLKRTTGTASVIETYDYFSNQLILTTNSANMIGTSGSATFEGVYNRTIANGYIELVNDQTEFITLYRNVSLSLLAGDLIEFTSISSSSIPSELRIGTESYNTAGSGQNTYRYTLVNNQNINSINFSLDIVPQAIFRLTSFRITRYKSLNQSMPTFYVSPYSQKDGWVANGTYDLKIYENDQLMQIQTNINISCFQSVPLFYEKTGDVQCRLTIFDQRSNVIDLSVFHISVQRTLLGQSTQFYLYTSDFYSDYNSNVSIWIYDRFNILKYNTTLIATNFIDIQLDVYSLKIKNMCEKFTYVNVTRDPNFYPLDTQFWSEWVAPSEIIEYRLFADYYRVEITNFENSSSQYYSYTFASDDILLVESGNTILNVINNIQNVNSTLGNQITNVEINITNQNSQINNSIINVEINLSNVNSTLGNMLVNIESTVTALGNNISTLYIFTNNSFYALNNSIQTSFTELTSTVYLINNTIFTAVQSLSMELNNINNTIMGNLSLVLRQNEYLTQIYQYTMFSDFLDWSNASRNESFIADQIETVRFLNQFTNTSAEIYLRYANQTESLLTFAQDTLTQMLPKDTEYRVKSVRTGEYLGEWKPVNKTISFGYDDKEYGEETLSGISVVDVVIALIITVGFIGIFVYTLRKIPTMGLQRIKQQYEPKKERDTESKNPIDSIRGRSHAK